MIRPGDGNAPDAWIANEQPVGQIALTLDLPDQAVVGRAPVLAHRPWPRPVGTLSGRKRNRSLSQQAL